MSSRQQLWIHCLFHTLHPNSVLIELCRTCWHEPLQSNQSSESVTSRNQSTSIREINWINHISNKSKRSYEPMVEGSSPPWSMFSNNWTIWLKHWFRRAWNRTKCYYSVHAGWDLNTVTSTEYSHEQLSIHCLFADHKSNKSTHPLLETLNPLSSPHPAPREGRA